MPTIIHKIERKDISWERLHTMYHSMFLHGKCYEFAIALHQGLGWQIVGLIEEGEVQHAGVRSSDGEIFDIRGFVSKEDFGKPYSKILPYDIREIAEANLYEIREIQDYIIERARQLAEVLWPELPWKETYVSKVKSYADDLEKVSREHNKWVRTPPGSVLSQIQDGDGHEGGYEIRPTVDGFGYTINCYLVP